MDKDEIVKESMEKKRKYRETFRCMDCGTDTFQDDQDYSVHDDVWIQASGLFPGGFFGFLCLQCLKTRLGRDLKLSDFMLEYEVNDHITQELLNEVNS